MKALKINHRIHGRKIIVTTVSVLLMSIGLVWSWNTIGVDLFGLPSATFRHALAFLAGLTSIAVLFRWILKDSSTCPERIKE